MSGRLAIGLVVPFRDERALLGRKLANLARLRWPAGGGEIVLVDDHSRDGGAELVRDSRLGGQPLVLLPAVGRPGKPAAIARGLARLAGRVELVVLCDADVCLAPTALLELERAFARDPRLALACGSQHFRARLPEDGSIPADEPSRAGLWDRATALVRRVESALGLVLDAHGQLLAWRERDGLAPPTGWAADDVGLVHEVRRRGLGRTILCRAACFYEEKPTSTEARHRQAVRRARAFFQALQHDSPGGGPLARLQWRLYRWLPRHLGLFLGISALALLGLGLALAPRLALGSTLALAALLGFTPLGRALNERLRVHAEALRAERVAPLGDHWARDRA